MIIPFDCPRCGTKIEAETSGLRRRVVECSGCQESIQIPEDLAVCPGTVIGNGYRLERKLEDSSLGEMYLATQESQGRYVSIEVLSGETSQDEEKVTRLMQEIELVATLKHPNIFEAIEAGQDGDTYFLVNAYEPGVTLTEHLAENGPLDEAEALKIALAVAEALDHAWETKKILHRDVKPANIFVTTEGETRLTGFGIAKSSEGQSLGLTGVGFTIGTPEYMSPEQIKAEDDLDFRADLYSLGVVLYECLAGGLPFDETAPILLMQKHMDEVPEPVNTRNESVSESTTALVAQMLEKERDARGLVWRDVVAQMKSVAGVGEPAAAPADAAAGPAAASGGKKIHPGVWIGIGAAVLLLIIIILVIVL